MSRYSCLKKYLAKTGKEEITLSFLEIERILGFSLPASARNLRVWWSNDRYHSQSKNGWLSAGYMVIKVDFDEETVTFRKTAAPLRKPSLIFNRALSIKALSELEKIYGKMQQNVETHYGRTVDFASADGRAVGEIIIVQNKRSPSAYMLKIAGHIWFLEKTRAEEKFLIFYGDRSVPEWWLKRYGQLIEGVRFYFMEDDGRLIELKICEPPIGGGSRS